MKKLLTVFLAGAALLPMLARAQIVDTMWTRHFDAGDSTTDLLTAIVADTLGNVYSTGIGRRSGTHDDFWTTATDRWGVRLWQTFYDGNSHLDDSASGIVLDPRRNVYVSGTAVVNETLSIVAAKYDTAGHEVWAKALHFPGDVEDLSVGIALSDSGALYACGTRHTDSTAYHYDYVTVRYDPITGDTLWTRTWDRPDENLDDFATALATDHSGNVLVTGYAYSSENDYDYATLKYDSTGALVWVRYYDRGGDEDDARAIAVDRSDDVIVTGQSYDGTTDFDFATIQYGPAGETLWVRRYNRSPASAEDIATVVRVDAADNVCVTGASNNEAGSTDYATIRYDSTGHQRWVARYTGAGDENVPNALASDANQNVCVTGWSFDPASGNYRVATVKYDATSGLPIWTHLYLGIGNNDAWGQGIAFGPAGIIFVGAQVVDTVTAEDYGILRLYEPAYDCGASDVVAPVETVFVDTTFTPRILVHNYGVNADTVRFRITIGAHYLDTTTLYLPPDTAETLAFRPTVESLVGVYAVRCTTIQAQDYNPLNNVARDSFAATIATGIKAQRSLVVIRPYLAVAPNPAVNIAWVHYAVPDPERLKLKLYDATGRLVRDLSNRGPKAGAVNLSLRNLASGVYIVKLETPSFKSTRKLVITRN